MESGTVVVKHQARERSVKRNLTMTIRFTQRYQSLAVAEKRKGPKPCGAGSGQNSSDGLRGTDDDESIPRKQILETPSV